MKTLICVLMLLLLAGAWDCSGQSVSLAWNAVPDPAVTNYVLYATNSAIPSGARVEVGTNTTCTVSNLAAGNWSFYVTSMASFRLESVPSSTVVADVPAPPANARFVVLSYSGTVATTNWQNLGFFMLKAP